MAEDAAPVWHFGAKKSLHVFSEDDSGTHVNNSICDDVEQPPLVLGGFAFACAGDWLAREAEREDVHQSSKLSVWEGRDIRPNRSRIQEPGFHFTDEIGLDKPLNFTISDGSQSVSKDCFEAKSNTGIAGAEFKSCNGMITHGIVRMVKVAWRQGTRRHPPS